MENFVVPLIMVLFIAVYFLYTDNARLRKERLVAPAKAKKTISDIKKRMLFDRMAEADLFDGIIATEEEFEEIQEVEAERFNFMEAQSRFFLECAINLMSHSYEDLDKLKQDAADIFEIAFDEEVLNRSQKKDSGGDSGVREAV